MYAHQDLFEAAKTALSTCQVLCPTSNAVRAVSTGADVGPTNRRTRKGLHQPEPNCGRALSTPPSVLQSGGYRGLLRLQVRRRANLEVSV